MPFAGQAQFIGSDVIEIIVEKGGKLEGALKKANALNAKKLSIKEPEGNPITAKLNEKDLIVLAGMSQLEELYLDIDIDDSGSYKYKSKNGKITNANFYIFYFILPLIRLIFLFSIFYSSRKINFTIVILYVLN